MKTGLLKEGYAVLTQTLCGPEAALTETSDGDNESTPAFFATRAEAEAEIAEYLRDQYQQVLDGERALEEVSGDEEFVAKVRICDDGSYVFHDLETDDTLLIVLTEPA
mgnify:FL=1